MSLLANAISFVRAHFPAILLAIVIGMASGAPQFFVIHQMGSSYQGIFPEAGNDDRYYQVRSHEVRDGFAQLGNPYILELRDAPSVAFWMPDATLSYAGKVLGIDVQNTFAVFDFVLPPILFLLTYGILLYATENVAIALFGAALFHLGFFLSTLFRSPSPQLNFLFVQFAILCGLRLVKKARYATVTLALSLGALFYSYPYYWTYLYGTTGAFFLVTLFQSRLRHLSLPLFTALSGGVILGSPVLFQMIAMSHLHAYQETVSRLGMIQSHTPTGIASISLVGLFCLLLALGIYRIRPLKDDAAMWFFASAVIGGILTANNQIITGHDLEFSSHYFLPVAYSVLLGSTYLAVMVIRQMKERSLKHLVTTGGVVILTCIILIGGFHSIAERTILRPNQLVAQKYGPVMQWLNENTSPESVVLAGEETSSFIPAYTSNRIFYSRNANLHVMTDAEAWTRFFLLYHGATYDDAFFTNHVGQIWGAHYFDEFGHEMQLNKVRAFLGQPQVPVEPIPQIAKDTFKAFAAHLEKQPVQAVLGNRKIDYAISEKEFAIPSWMKTLYPDMRAVYTEGEFTVFALGARKF